MNEFYNFSDYRKSYYPKKVREEELEAEKKPSEIVEPKRRFSKRKRQEIIEAIHKG